VKGTGFSPYFDTANQAGALAPEGMFFEFLIPLAPTLNAAQREEVRQIVAAHGAGLTLRLIDDIGAVAGGARAALFHSRAAIVASGTATVEAALIGNPFVVVYRVSPLTFAIAKRVVKVPFVAMANLIAGKQVVPELIQDDFTAENIVQHIRPLLPDGPARQSMMEELARIRGLLSKESAAGAESGSIDRVAAGYAGSDGARLLRSSRLIVSHDFSRAERCARIMGHPEGLWIESAYEYRPVGAERV
jgi:lipid-A-disaccharide synthase